MGPHLVVQSAPLWRCLPSSAVPAAWPLRQAHFKSLVGQKSLLQAGTQIYAVALWPQPLVRGSCAGPAQFLLQQLEGQSGFMAGTDHGGQAEVVATSEI